MSHLMCLFCILFILVSFQGFCEVEARNIKQQKCGTGNSIDDCWRCHAHYSWDQNRTRLADCAHGFGKDAAGGERGKLYVITDSGDHPTNPQPGTLRHAVIQVEPLWITFARDMVINLQAELMMNNHKTIDGRGADVHITGYGCITIQNVAHIIIHGVHIRDCKPSLPGKVIRAPNDVIFAGGSDGDGLMIKGSSDVWIDHCSLTNCTDGLVDVTHNSTRVTISNCFFTHHNKVMLLGHSDEDTSEDMLRVTVAYNYFGGELGQRMPRCRHGSFHVVNNYYSSWNIYAVGGTANPSILSQGNIYIAPDSKSKKEVTNRHRAPDGQNWNWLSSGDEFRNGAFFVASGSKNLHDYQEMFSMEAKSSSQVNGITADAGVLKCQPGVPCVHNYQDAN